MRIPLACVVTMAASVGCASMDGTAEAPREGTSVRAEPQDVPHEGEAVMQERGDVVAVAAPTPTTDPAPPAPAAPSAPAPAVAAPAPEAPAPAASAAAAPPAPAPPAPAVDPKLLPHRDGRAHRYELRVFDGDRIEVFMDGERVPDERIMRDGRMIGVRDAEGTVIERLDLPQHWTPQHGAPGTVGKYRTFDGTELVPPAAMLGGRLGDVPPAVLAHLHAEHTAADGSACAVVESVIPGLPLAAAGVVPHDVIVTVDGSPNASAEAIRAVVRGKRPGDAVAFGLVRAGHRRDVTVTLSAWDPKHMVRPLRQPEAAAPATASDKPSWKEPPPPPAPPAPVPPPPPAPPTDAELQAQLAAARARIAELERELKSDVQVRRAIRAAPAPAPTPPAGTPGGK
jgi:hypothetical protein